MGMTDADHEARALAALAATVAQRPPAALRARTLDAARAARPAGHLARRPSREPEPGAARDAVDVYCRQLDAFDHALTDVTDWSAVTDIGWTTQQTLAHAVEVERYFGSVLGLWPFELRGPEHDHHAMTSAAMAAAHDVEPATLHAAWRDVASRVRAVLETGPLPETITFHTLEMTTASCLALRAFELWTHGDDLRQAIGRALDTPAPDDMELLANTAVGLVPLGMAIRGVRRVDDTVRFVLTGPGGGTWIERLSSTAPMEPTLTVIADVVDFCRVAAQRLDIDQLELEVNGDHDTARDVLVGASAFAA